ncbi:DUF934 domain-containing protein [Nitrincola alkalilacustris]|uniref:DUF934 domain-containing protein n=1 Tax=Nitrincola alkalilacustris TaxID=1571224 RepID=UPI00124EE630|nr:DUF934 domain-containing protein [Nitrincola alkalilacustris]
MPLLLDRQIAENTWQFVEESLPADTGNADLVVPFELLPQLLDQHQGRCGVRVPGELPYEELLPFLERVALIEIEFPIFRDGRGFSLARLLRRAGFTGEVRAVGDVSRDRLGYMERCGFNAWMISDERFSESDLQAFAEISVRYQAGADDPRPIYRQQ